VEEVPIVHVLGNDLTTAHQRNVDFSRTWN